MYYVCADGSYLQYNANSPDRFLCPSTNTYYTGEPYASSWNTYRHNQIKSYYKTLAIAYYFTGNDTYGRTAADLLLQYASFYSWLPVRHTYSHFFLIFSLSRSVTLIQILMLPLEVTYCLKLSMNRCGVTMPSSPLI